MNFIVGGEGRSGRRARAACPGPRVHTEPSAKAEPAVCIPGATQRPACDSPGRCGRPPGDPGPSV